MMPFYISNGTVLGRWPLSRSIPILATALIVFFVLLEPEASRGLDIWQRMIFWTLHVATGLLGLSIASAVLLPRVMSRLSPALAIIGSGAVGALFTTPLFFFLEFVLPASLTAIENGALDRLAEQNLWLGLLVEYIEAAPLMLLCWLLINLPLLATQRPSDTQDTTEDVPEHVAEHNEQAQRLERFFDRLPLAIGHDLYAISSDLHYLHVYTAEGRCMIHGSLQDVSDTLGDAGLRVHRSHWVARHAVRQLIRNKGQSFCLLKNGLRIPVSRRNRAAVQQWFGSNMHYQAVLDRHKT
ncbi:MAG: LytTR family transcriptional regulator DNA-binding domain-containing protein [Pseudomonadota bacterium]